VLAPLQAADLTGWTMRRAAKGWLTDEPERSTPPAVLDALMEIRNVPHLAGYLDQANIVKFCERHNVPKQGEAGVWQGVIRG
jgi:hypothetical protein